MLHHAAFPFLARKLLYLLLLTVLAGCQQDIKLTKGRPYRIKGQVTGCEGCQVSLQLYDYNRTRTTQTTIQADTVQKGRFQISGRTTRPGFYEVHVRPLQGSGPLRAIIYLPADPVEITANINGLPAGRLQRLESQFRARNTAGTFARITATSPLPVQAEINTFLFMQDSLALAYFKKEEKTYADFRATYDSGNRQLINAWADSVRQVIDKFALFKAYAADLFIRRYPISEAAILAMLENHHESTTNYRFNKYFKRLSPPMQTSYYGQILARKLTVPDKPAKYKQHWVGSSITYLKGKTPAGRQLDVLAEFRKNKLTLVNFWASWHGPSRWQMPAFQQLYQQHHDKGFGIIAVSFDRDHRAWTQAIAQEGLAFRHVSELKGKEAEEYKRFRIRDMPFNILFDAKGNMVAVDLSPKEVAQKLKQAL
jgi:thiol-disulfide isomerase/thioredoxin